MSKRIHNSSPQQRAALPGLSKEDKKYTLDLIVIPVYRALSDMGMNRISDAGLY